MHAKLENGTRPAHDAFISYSRKNEAFAGQLEKALERFKAPKGLPAPQRHLEIFRDRQDFTGSEYHRSLERHLRDSAKLLVVCSPEASRSEYVNDEIRQFARLNSPDNIIPVLLSGIPNNEARPGQEAERAFPAALCDIMPMPLAADFRGFAPGNKPDQERFRDAWYTTLANIYDVSRSEIEQRDRKRRARARTIAATIGAVVLGLIAAAAIATWNSRVEVKVAGRNTADEQYVSRIAQAKQAYDDTNLPRMRDYLRALIPTAAAASTDIRGFEWFYLWRLSQGPEGSIATRAVPKTLAWSPDDALLAAGDDAGIVTFWLPGSHQEIGRLDAQGGPITSVSFSPDGSTVATASAKGPVKLWESGTRRFKEQLPELGEAVGGLAFSPSAPALAAIGYANARKVVRIWDTSARRVTATISGDPTASGSGLFTAFSADGSMLALSNGFGVRLCRLPSGEKIAEFDGAGRYVSAIAFSPDGNTLAAASDDGKLLFFDIPSRRVAGTLDAHSDYVTSVAYSRDGKILATAASDKTVKLWDARTHEGRAVWKGHTGQVDAMVVSPDGTTVASAGADKSVRFWQVSARPEYDELNNLDVLLTSIAASPRDDRFAVSTASSVVLWDPNSRRQTARLAGHRDVIAAIAFSPDQKTIALASSNGGVELWDTIAGKTDALHGHTGQVYAVAFSPDGNTLASAGADRVVRFWDVAARQPAPSLLEGHTKDVTAVVFSPNGKMIATGGNDRTVRLWEAKTGRQLASEPACSGTLPDDLDESQQPLITSVDFAPDGRTLAASGADGIVMLWRVLPAALQKTARLSPEAGIINDVVFSPDGRTLASAGVDGTLRLWRLSSSYGQLLALSEPKSNKPNVPHFMLGSENQVVAVAFSRDGRFLVNGLLDGTVRVREAADHNR